MKKFTNCSAIFYSVIYIACPDSSVCIYPNLVLLQLSGHPPEQRAKLAVQSRGSDHLKAGRGLSPTNPPANAEPGGAQNSVSADPEPQPGQSALLRRPHTVSPGGTWHGWASPFSAVISTAVRSAHMAPWPADKERSCPSSLPSLRFDVVLWVCISPKGLWCFHLGVAFP